MGLESEKSSINKTYVWVAIIIGVAIFGYGLLNFISKENERTNQTEIQNKVSIENKVKCQKDGQQFYEKQQSRNEVSEFSYAVVVGNQRYAYSKELNTCLIAWEDVFSIRKLDPLSTHHITDVYSNIDIYAWAQLKGG